MQELEPLSAAAKWKATAVINMLERRIGEAGWERRQRKEGRDMRGRGGGFQHGKQTFGAGAATSCGTVLPGRAPSGQAVEAQPKPVAHAAAQQY